MHRNHAMHVFAPRVSFFVNYIHKKHLAECYLISAKFILDSCLYCYMTFEFFRIFSFQNNIIFIIIFFHKSVNISLGNGWIRRLLFTPFTATRFALHRNHAFA